MVDIPPKIPQNTTDLMMVRAWKQEQVTENGRTLRMCRVQDAKWKIYHVGQDLRAGRHVHYRDSVWSRDIAGLPPTQASPSTLMDVEPDALCESYLP